MDDKTKEKEIVRQYRECEVGYDSSVRLLRQLGYTEAQADRLLVDRSR